MKNISLTLIFLHFAPSKIPKSTMIFVDLRNSPGFGVPTSPGLRWIFFPPPRRPWQVPRWKASRHVSRLKKWRRPTPTALRSERDQVESGVRQGWDWLAKQWNSILKNFVLIINGLFWFLYIYCLLGDYMLPIPPFKGTRNNLFNVGDFLIWKKWWGVIQLIIVCLTSLLFGHR